MLENREGAAHDADSNMSRATRLAKDEHYRAALERRFQERLIEALVECAQHRVWGMFGQNDAADNAHFGKTPESLGSQAAEELLRLGSEINTLRARLGLEAFPLYHRYLWYRSQRGANALGEPQLAAAFLAELEATANS